MIVHGVVRHERGGYAPVIRRWRDRLAEADSETDDELDRRAPVARRSESVLGRTVGVTSAAFAVGFAQGRFGTSKVAGVPAEIVAGGLLHATAACAGLPVPAREALRALGDGAIAAAALTLGYQLGLGKR